MIIVPAYPSVPVSRVCALPMANPNPTCELCSLSQQSHRSTCIPADGEPGGLLVVGKGPGVDEDRAGRPDVGRSGRYLRAQIKRLWHGPVAYENSVKCLLPAELSHKCIDACRVFLAGTVAAVQPTRVIALGAEAVYALLGRTVAPLSVRRGYGWMVGPSSITGVTTDLDSMVVTKPGSCVPVFFVMHPAAALRNRFLAQMFEADLEWALKAPPPFPPPWDVQAHVIENEVDALEAAAALRASKWFAFDVETAGRMYDSGFTMLSAACTPNDTRMAYVWCREALTDPVVRAPLLNVLADPKVAMCLQNAKFDEQAVWCAYGVQIRGVVFDTLLQRKLLDPDASGKLEVLSELVGMGGHKEEAGITLGAGVRFIKELSKPGSDALAALPPEVEAKIRLGEEPLAPYLYALLSKDVLVRYNARDAVSTAWLESVLEPQVAADEGLTTILNEVVFPAARALVHVERWGIQVNQMAVMQFQTYLGTKIDEVRGRFDTLVGKDFNPNSSPQVSKLLFEKLRLPPDKTTDTGRFSTDKDTLEGLKGKHPVVDDLLLWRRFTKLKGTYADGLLEHIRSDERVHPSFHPDGARSGRLSCSEPNLQNIPRAKDSPEGKMARDCFIAPPGRELLEGDYCLVPETRVLTADFRWVPIGEIKVGSHIVAFDENRKPVGKLHRGERQIRRALVESVVRRFVDCFHVATDRGVIIASAEHRWLARRAYKGSGLRWMKTSDLTPDWAISYFCRPWDVDESREGGWMAGILDGEGWVSPNGTCGFGQNPGLILDTACEKLRKDGFDLSLNPTKSGCVRVRVMGERASWRLLGRYQPLRLRQNFRWEGRRSWSRLGPPARVLSITPVGKREVVSLQTSERTLIAEGYMCHNSQNELRVAAMLSGDPKMIGIFTRGEDYHLRTAQLVSWQAWGIPPEQVTEVHRTQAKTFNFSSLFGAGDENLAGQLGLTEEKIERIRNAIFGEFTVLAAWIQKQIEIVRRVGYVRTFWKGKPARKRSLYQIADEGESYKRGTAERGSYNSAIQGTAADFCTKSVADIVRWIIDDCFPAKLVLTVHDSIMFEVDADFVEEAAANMKRIMEGQPTWNGVRLVVDFKRGLAWGSMDKYEVGKKAV